MKRLSGWFCVFWVLSCCISVYAEETYQPPRLSEEGAWSMVVVPDTQSYVKFGRNQGVLELMTAWIAENLEPLRIQQVVCVGDIVECNNISQTDGKTLNQTSAQMWAAAARAMERLDGKTAYVVCTGNHDHGTRSAENRETQLDTYFPVTKNPAWQGVLVDQGENSFGKKTLECAAYEWATPNGQKMLTVTLPFAPSDENLQWAKNLVAQEKYAHHFVILVTHSYLHANDKRIEKEGYVLNKEGGNAGEAIWQKLVYPSTNIRMVLCGHISKADDFRGCVGFAKEKNAAGKWVSQMLFDTQALGGGWHGNGGDGWLRLLEFSPDMKKVTAKTFSPLFAISPATRHLAWNREDYNEFTFTLDEE